MPLSRKLAKLLIEKNIAIADMVEALRSYNLLSLLPGILISLKQLARGAHTYDTLLIESPFEMSETSVKHIKRLVGNDLAAHEVSVNPHLLAGFKARFKGMLYDGSAERVIKEFIRN
jgi:F0F1-type ATP synthase delta subunit